MPRLFTGLELPRAVVGQLALTRGGIVGARWLEPEDYHVTLRFIGDVDGRAAREIAETLGDISRPKAPVRFAPGASKQRQADRRAATASLLTRSFKYGILFSDAMRGALADGFGPLKRGEDPFDAALGLLGMIEVVDGRRAAAPTFIEEVDSEGWILGQAA